jgi:hypothetical protein
VSHASELVNCLKECRSQLEGCLSEGGDQCAEQHAECLERCLERLKACRKDPGKN